MFKKHSPLYTTLHQNWFFFGSFPLSNSNLFNYHVKLFMLCIVGLQRTFQARTALLKESVEWDHNCLLAISVKKRDSYTGSSAAAQIHSVTCGLYKQISLRVSGGYLRVAEEKQAEDRVGSEEVNEGTAQAPPCQGKNGEPSHHKKDGMWEGQFPALWCLRDETKMGRQKKAKALISLTMLKQKVDCLPAVSGSFWSGREHEDNAQGLICLNTKKQNSRSSSYLFYNCCN